MATTKVCKECGDTLFEYDFHVDLESPDRRSDICIECEEERQDAKEPAPDLKSYLRSRPKSKVKQKPEPPKKKRGPGRPKGSVNKAKPATKAKPPIPTTSKTIPKEQSKPGKIDLSKFKKIRIDQRISDTPMLTIAKGHAFSFNTAAAREFKINKIAGIDAYLDDNGAKKIVFVPLSQNPTFMIKNPKNSQYGFSSKKLFAQLGVKNGRYQLKNESGYMVFEDGSNQLKDERWNLCEPGE